MLKRIINYLPLTKFRIFCAKLLFHITKLVYRSNKQVVTRKGIRYELDLSEGIDLSIFLFGNFQKHVFNSSYFNCSESPIIFDIGANIGHMTLTYAKRFPEGKIYAFEPTDFASKKLKRNLELNPALSKNVTVVKAFVSDKTELVSDIKAFASWKVDGHYDDSELVHPLHKGTVKEANKTPSFTLDDFVAQNNIGKIDFIKIDTDGHEIEVFNGAKESIKQFKPLILFEVSLYGLQEKNLDFQFYFDYFKAFDYSLINSKNGHVITKNNYLSEIPAKSTTDVIVLFHDR